MITLVVAAARNGVIGKDGAIPWHISDDLKHFKALTVNQTVIMGRKTWDSLPKKPLPNRVNVVVTRDPGWRAAGAVAATLLDEALHIANTNNTDAMIVGGAQIYHALLPRAGRIEITEVEADFDGDAHFTFDRSGWRETARERYQTPEGLGYSYITLIRK